VDGAGQFVDAYWTVAAIRFLSDPRDVQNHRRLLVAVEQAISFLAERQLPHGEFPSLVSAQPDLNARCAPDSNYFTTPQVLWSLGFVRDRRVSSLVRRAARFLAAGVESDGSWRFFTARVRRHIDPDVDVTACAAAALRTRPRDAGCDLVRTRAVLLSTHDQVGRFRTWIRSKPANDLDSVANANVLWFLGDDPATAGAAHWLCSLVEADAVSGSYPYYESPLALYHAIARAFFAGASQLASLRNKLIPSVVGCARPDGSFGNVLDTAFAVCALHNLGASEHSTVNAAVASLLRHQRRDGSWQPLAAWNGPEWPAPRSLWWGSECWTTALAMEALARVR
jgi:hypothetical protein